MAKISRDWFGRRVPLQGLNVKKATLLILKVIGSSELLFESESRTSL